MGYVATDFDVMNFNFDIMNYNSEVSLFPPTPPPMPMPMPSGPIELLVVEPFQGNLTEIMVVNDPVVTVELVLPDVILSDADVLSSVSSETFIASEPETVVVLPSVSTTSLIKTKPIIIVVLPDPMIEKEPKFEPLPVIREINFDCLPMEVQDLYFHSNASFEISTFFMNI